MKLIQAVIKPFQLDDTVGQWSLFEVSEDQFLFSQPDGTESLLEGDQALLLPVGLFFPILNTELSLRLGSEIFATGSGVEGSIFNDRIVVGPDVISVNAGAGNDVITSFTYDTAGRILDGGVGDDLYLLGDADGDGVVDDCLIFDLGSGGPLPPGDQIVLLGFSADSQIVDLGEGVIEVFDTDGDVEILEVQYPDGSPVDGQTIINSLIFPNETGVTFVGGGPRPLLIIAEDVEGTTELPRLVDWADRARSDTFIFDESIVQPFDAGGGEDVILVDLADARAGQTYQFDGGRGNDLIQVDNRASTAVDLVLHLDGGGGHDQLLLDIAGDGISDFSLTGVIVGGKGNDSHTVTIDWGEFTQDTELDILVLGGAGDDELNGQAMGQPFDLKQFPLAFYGGRGNDVLDLQDIWSYGYGETVASGGSGHDTINVEIASVAGTGASAGPLSHLVSGGLGNDIITVTSTGSGGGGNSTVPAVVTGGLGSDVIDVAVSDFSFVIADGVSKLDSDQNQDEITVDFRGASDGGGAEIKVGEDDLLTLRYDVGNPTDVDDCLIFDLTLGGVDEKRAEIYLPDFGAETELTFVTGAIELVDPATGLAQILNVESTDGTPLTPEQIEQTIIIYGTGWDFGDIA